ncbi:MAG: Protein-disulfide reductase, partial [Bacteroidota bacterium]
MDFFAGASFANFLSTHWIPNMLFFTIFILFGISFLGAFEIVLPSNLVNSVDAKSDKGGFIGVFFMAFTLVLVSFSCTGPLAGSILIAASQGAFLKPIIGMLGFSLAFAIPFTLFAIFPGFMQKLPKSGNWMNEVKVVLGFLEIALAFKFLSVADQVYHWHLLDREIFLAIWIAIFTALTLYLFGKISLPHDGPAKNLSVPRTLFATAVLAFVIYLVPGMFGAPLKGLSGWLPP